MANAKNGGSFDDDINIKMREFKLLFGRRVKYYRDLKNFTQEYLAELVNLEQVSLSNIERGKSHPSFETMYRLAIVLGVKPHQLYMVEPPIPVQDMAKEISAAMSVDKNLAELMYKFFCTIH